MKIIFQSRFLTISYRNRCRLKTLWRPKVGYTRCATGVCVCFPAYAWVYLSWLKFSIALTWNPDLSWKYRWRTLNLGVYY